MVMWLKVRPEKCFSTLTLTYFINLNGHFVPYFKYTSGLKGFNYQAQKAACANSDVHFFHVLNIFDQKQNYFFD